MTAAISVTGLTRRYRDKLALDQVPSLLRGVLLYCLFSRHRMEGREAV
jgi:hypothetical protein